MRVNQTSNLEHVAVEAYDHCIALGIHKGCPHHVRYHRSRPEWPATLVIEIHFDYVCYIVYARNL